MTKAKAKGSTALALATPKMTPHRAAFENLRAHLQTELLERNREVPVVLAAYLAGEHVFLLGPPGTAKTMLIKLLASSLDACVFDFLMSKFSTPEELFGPYSVSALQQDRFVRAGDGMLQHSDFASLDEVWKANSAILNHLLRLLNEREFHNGTDGVQQTPLQMVMGASNELPQDESLGALYDRFLVRLWVGPLKQAASRKELLRRVATKHTPPPAPRLTAAQLCAIRDEVDRVDIPDKVLDVLCAVWQRVDGKGVYVSPRRWAQTVGLLKSYAWVQGDAVVSDDHIALLCDCLWDAPEQRAIVLEQVLQETNPQGMKALELFDAAREVFDGAGDTSESIIAAGKRVKDTLKELRKLDTGNRQVVDVIADVEKLRDELRGRLAALM